MTLAYITLLIAGPILAPILAPIPALILAPIPAPMLVLFWPCSGPVLALLLPLYQPLSMAKKKHVLGSNSFLFLRR